MPQFNRYSNRVKLWATLTVFNNSWIRAYFRASLDLAEQEVQTFWIKRKRAMLKTKNKQKFSYNNGSYRCSNNSFYSKYSGLREVRQWSFNQISASLRLIHNLSSISQFYRSPSINSLSKNCSLKQQSIIIRSLCSLQLKMNLCNSSTPKFTIRTSIISNWAMLCNKLRFNSQESIQQ